MALKVKPKRFGPVVVSFDGTERLLYAYGDAAEYSPHPPAGSPVDTLIASLGSCIVKSVEWAANQRKVPLKPFQVRVTGTKSAELPGRIEKVEIAILGDLAEDEILVGKILKQAKAICTVSNSLNSEIAISVQQA